MNRPGSGDPRRQGGGFRGPGQNPSQWIGGRTLDARRGKERAKASEECAGDARPLTGILDSYLSRSSLGEVLLPATTRFREAWAKAAGEGLAKRANPVGFKDGILELEVPDAAWKFELRFREAALLEALRREGIVVKGIRAR